MSNARNLGNITTGGATGATTASVTTSVNNLIDSAPGALDTLNELAAALGDDANFSTTVTNSIATKLNLTGGTMTGTVTVNTGGGDANNASHLGGDFSTWIRIGDGTSSQTQTNGYGIKLHDAGVIHWSVGGLGTDFKISKTNTNGAQLFPASRYDALTITTAGNINIGNAGSLTLTSTIGSNTTTAFGSMNGRISFDNDYSDVARGPNKLVLQNDTNWISGLGISNNYLDIYTGGNIRFLKSTSPNAYTENMVIKYDGSVGIGTTNPLKTLTVRGTSGDVVQAKIIYAGADGNRSGLILQNTHTGGREYGLYVGNNSTGGGLGNSFGISDNTAGTAYRLIIDSSGNVGIGTNTPGARLHVLNDSGSPAVNTNDTDPLIRLGTADGVHGGIDLHATQKYSTLRSTAYRTTSSNSFGFGYNAYNMGTIDIGRVDQGYTWNATNGNGEYTGGIQQQPRYTRKAHFSGQILANNTYYTIAENMSESRFTIECFCGDASSRDYKKYVGYYTSTAYGVYGLTQVIHMNGGWNSGSFDMRVSAPNGNLSIDLRFSSYYNSANVASWMCIYTSFV